MNSGEGVAVGRREHWLPRLAVLAAVAGALETGALLWLGRQGDSRFALPDGMLLLGLIGLMVLPSAVGALIIVRRPGTRIAWIMLAIGLAVSTGVLLFGYGLTGLPPRTGHPFAMEAALIGPAMVTPLFALGMTSLLLIYPTDDFVSPRWRWVAILALVAAATLGLENVLRPDVESDVLPGLANPIAPSRPWSDMHPTIAAAGFIAALAAAMGGVTSLVVRYRRAGAAVAAQIRLLAIFAATSSTAFVVGFVVQGPAFVVDLAFGIGIAALAGLPIAIGFGITRYHTNG